MNFKQQIISLYYIPSIKIKHIVLFGVLCFFLSDTLAQVRPGQLRNEIMQMQNPTPKSDTKTKKKTISRITRPLKNPSPLAPIVNPLNNKNTSLVYLENTQTLAFDQFTNPDVQILRGNVRFRHDGALLYCDSAYFYEKANSLDAFSNVRIVGIDNVQNGATLQTKLRLQLTFNPDYIKGRM